MNNTYTDDTMHTSEGRDPATCNKLFFCGLTQELYSMQPDDWTKLAHNLKNGQFMDIWILLTKFNKAMYGLITQEKIQNLPPVLDRKYIYPDENEIPNQLYSTIAKHEIKLIMGDVSFVVSFIKLLRALFITLGIDEISTLFNTNTAGIKNLKAKLSQTDELIFLSLYRALANIELQMSFNEVFKNAAIGGKIRADKIRREQNNRLNHLGSHIESMNHGEILELLSTKQNCFNILFELDYEYQQINNTITKSKLSLQDIRESVENDNGAYNLASTSVGRWLVKRMPFWLWYILKDKPNYKSYYEIPWFNAYLKQFLKFLK